MKHKKSIGEITFDIFNHIFMVFLIVVTIYPVWYVLVASLSSGSMLMSHRGALFLPMNFNTNAYIHVFKNPMVTRGYLNTGFIVVVGTFLNVLMTSIAGYFLSRRDVFWKKYIMIMIVITMFFGGGLIPFYLVVKNMGLLNSLWSLIIPGIVSTYNIIVMRTSFMSIPVELEESAVIDGASHITILFKIIIPVSLPVIAVMVLWYGVGHWNSWFAASIFIIDRKLFPLQLILREILIQNETDSMTRDYGFEERGNAAEAIKYALIVVATVPILCIYPFLQKYFVKGVMIGAIKG
ncbi:MAG: carbohydrate ABC transporter permease [Peptostreptococcales bacterium]